MRKLLLPFSLLYFVLISIRNFFYDKGWLRSFEFDFPIILVGNISTGGTGKTPHVEYLIRLLKKKYQVATLSRGYKRKLKGYALSTELSLVEDIGDEPKQFKQKFPDVEVAVSEDRVRGVYYLLNDEPDVKVILMDDGFQHRRIKPGLQFILTPYDHLYRRDMILPAGNLREPASGAKRAHHIIVSKCSYDLSEETRRHIVDQLKPTGSQQVFFTTMTYCPLKPLFSDQQVTVLEKNEKIILVTGIANAAALKDHLAQQYQLQRSFTFPDHYYFKPNDLAYFGKQNCSMVVTEKDAMRLMEQKDLIMQAGISIFVIPVEITFLFNGASAFEAVVEGYMACYNTPDN